VSLLTINELAAQIELWRGEGCELDEGRFRVQPSPDREAEFIVDELGEWGPTTIYIGRSPRSAARAICAERSR
jgi:hypothetical protein